MMFFLLKGIACYDIAESPVTMLGKSNYILILTLSWKRYSTLKIQLLSISDITEVAFLEDVTIRQHKIIFYFLLFFNKIPTKMESENTKHGSKYKSENTQNDSKYSNNKPINKHITLSATSETRFFANAKILYLSEVVAFVTEYIK